MKRINKLIAISLITATVLNSAPLTTGDILNQTKQPQIEQKTKDIPSVKGGEYKAPLNMQDTVKIMVKGFKFSGNSMISSEELQSTVAPYLNQNMGINKLKEVASLITKLYRDNSYFVARAYLPEQSLKDGMVEITVIEGQYGGFDVKNKSIVDNETVQGYMDYLKNGQIVSTESLERQMLLINDLGGAIVTNAEVYPGKEVGTSNFKIDVQETPKYSGYGIIDNYGSKYTGEYKASAGANINSVSGIGDVLSVNSMLSNTGNLKNAGISYDRPLSYNGLKAGVSASITDYTLDKIDNYEGDGSTKTVGAYVSYPILKTRAIADTIKVAVTHKDMSDSSGNIGSVTTADKSINSMTVSFEDKRSTNLLDNPGKLVSSISLTAGKLNLDNDTAKTNDAGLDSEGVYTKVNLDISHTHKLSKDLSLITNLRGQTSLNKNLDSSEDLSVGGSNCVRSYEDSELSGDKGYALSVDLMYSLPNYFGISSNSISLFSDTATIWKNKKTFNTEDNKRTLNDVGIGYNVSYDNMSAKTSFAHGFGNDAEPTSQTEFSKGQNKLLFQAIYSF